MASMLHAGERGKLAILCVLMCVVVVVVVVAVVGGGTGSVASPAPPLLSPLTQPTAIQAPHAATKNSVPRFSSPFSVPQQEVLPNTSRSKKEGGRTPCSQYWLQVVAESGAVCKAEQAWAWHLNEWLFHELPVCSGFAVTPDPGTRNWGAARRFAWRGVSKGMKKQGLSLVEIVRT